MRIFITFSVLAIFLVSFPSSAEAQLFNRLKNKAQKAAERKAEEKVAAEVERKAEQMVEKSWDAIFGDFEERAEGDRKPLFTMNSNVTTEEVYRFDTITTMEIQTIKKDGEPDPPAIMEMHFNQDEIYTGTKFSGEQMNKEDGNVFIVYDFKNSAMVMLMDSEDDKFSFAYDWEQALQETGTIEGDETDGQDEEINWDEAEEWKGYSRIGTKTISGYSCDGYRSENDKAVTEVWVTREAAFGMGDMFQAHANAKQLRGKVPSDYPYGMMMEMETEDLESGDKTTMKVTDIRQNANVAYSMSDYPAMSFGKK